MSEPLFAADSIGKSFRAQRVLTSASVWARAGSITVLLGRNGSGKSTLLRCAAGVLRPDHGVVRFRGRAWLRPRLPRLARDGLFWLPDRGLLPRRETPRRHLDAVERRFGPAGLDATAERLGILPRLDAPVEELSGGERRRAEIAIAALRRPLCLLADEPLLGIDPRDRETVATELRRLRDAGAAIVLSGHEVASLIEMADEVVWVVAGTTHGLGDAERAMRYEPFRRDYVGVGSAG